MSNIKQTYSIEAAPAEVWRALTDPKIIEKWSGAGAVLPLEVGATYSLWDGSIGGEIIEIMPELKLVQTWKPQNWTRTDSVVTFKLNPRGKGTRVDLVHVNVENMDYDGTSEGWNEYYLGAIQRMFEIKSRRTKHAKVIKAAKKPAKKKGSRNKASNRGKSRKLSSTIDVG